MNTSASDGFIEASTRYVDISAKEQLVMDILN